MQAGMLLGYSHREMLVQGRRKVLKSGGESSNVMAQSNYSVLHQGAFGGTEFLFLGRLGSQAST